MPDVRLDLLSTLAVSGLLWGCGDDVGPPAACDDAFLCTWAGDGVAAFDGDGHALLASSFYWPVDLSFGHGRTYVVDWNNHRVREVLADQTLKTVVGTDFVGDGPDDLSDQNAPGADGTTITLNHPTQFLPQANGTFVLVSWHNHKLRTFDPASGKAFVSCGGLPGFAGDNGMAKTAKLNQPVGLSLAPDGTGYLLDQRNQVIRKIDPSGRITTVAGTPSMAGFEGDGGSPLAAKMSQPTGSNPPPGGGITRDAQGRVYFSDVLNHRVRRVDFDANRIETVAGNGTAGFGGDGGPGPSAQLNNPRKLTIGPDGRLYIGDELNHRIRALDLESGVISTVAGTGEATFAGDGDDPVDAALFRPVGVSFDAEFMYILDTYNHRIRRVPVAGGS